MAKISILSLLFLVLALNFLATEAQEWKARQDAIKALEDYAYLLQNQLESGQLDQVFGEDEKEKIEMALFEVFDDLKSQKLNVDQLTASKKRLEKVMEDLIMARFNIKPGAAKAGENKEAVFSEGGEGGDDEINFDELRDEL